MLFLITLVVTFAAVMALRNPIKRFAVPIYVLAAVLSAALVASPAFLSSLVFSNWMLVFVRRCTLPLAMFVVVMFIGVLPKDGRLSRWLRPIRAELSIAAWILSLGHMLVFLETYLPGLLGLNISHGTVVASIVVALVLFVLLLVLGATSFRFVRDRIRVLRPGLRAPGADAGPCGPDRHGGDLLRSVWARLASGGVHLRLWGVSGAAGVSRG